MTFKDIYSTIDPRIVAQGFNEKDIEEQKQLVDKELKNYMLEKIDKLGIHGVLTSEHKDEVSTYQLAEVLATLIPANEHFETIRHLTHYVIGIVGALQCHSVTWWSSEDDVLEQPEITFTEDGKLDDLNTHPQESYLKVFETVYDTFQNKFMKENVDSIQYTIIKPIKKETE